MQLEIRRGVQDGAAEAVGAIRRMLWVGKEFVFHSVALGKPLAEFKRQSKVIALTVWKILVAVVVMGLPGKQGDLLG